LVTEEEDAQPEEPGGDQQGAPVQLLERFIDATGARPPPRAVDDRVGDIPIVLAPKLEVTTAAGIGDDTQRRSIEGGRQHGTRRVAVRFRNDAARGRAHADDENRDAAVLRGGD
jgi:hypothetical protein